MRILIVDDEIPARARMKSLVKEIDASCEIAGEAGNGQTAVDYCTRQPVDIVLMDIRMPVMDGLQAARLLADLPYPPAVIFTTAYDEHALAAFESNAMDYLVKPVRKERLAKALCQAAGLTQAQISALDSLQETDTYLTARYCGNLQRILLRDIIYLRAEQKYVQVKHQGGEVLIEDSLKSLEERWPEEFLRIHRNALVAPKQIKGLDKELDGRVYVCFRHSDTRLEVSRRHLPAVRRWVKSNQ